VYSSSYMLRSNLQIYVTLKALPHNEITMLEGMYADPLGGRGSASAGQLLYI